MVPALNETRRRLIMKAIRLQSVLQIAFLAVAFSTVARASDEKVAATTSQRDLQAKIEQWTSETGRPAEELVEDVMAVYFDAISRLHTVLDSRYDDIKSGNVKLIPGDEIKAHFAAKSTALHSRRS